MKNINLWAVCLLLVAAVGGGLLLGIGHKGLHAAIFVAVLFATSIGTGVALRSGHR